ncbi:MAG: hypothetical protein H6636_11670 [Anaerolineales bacterium]|nr:hypothetical protein [Anaerolineales bacterium]
MTTPFILPQFTDWNATKETLHAYSKVIGVIPRAHAVFHPKWWHISLKIVPDGLVTDNMPLPGGEVFSLKMNLTAHTILLQTSQGDAHTWPMTAGLTANELAEKIIGSVADLGLKGEYARQKFENADPRPYNPTHAETYFSVLVNVKKAFCQHRTSLPGEVGPIQLWPHGFDLSFEWFGTRYIETEEHGQKSTFPSQINLGFSPGEPSHPAPYFYSNPFPFETNQLLSYSLPHGARWFTSSWQGSLLEYSLLAGDRNGLTKLQDYARAVFEIASPGLMA